MLLLAELDWTALLAAEETWLLPPDEDVWLLTVLDASWLELLAAEEIWLPLLEPSEETIEESAVSADDDGFSESEPDADTLSADSCSDCMPVTFSSQEVSKLTEHIKIITIMPNILFVIHPPPFISL